MVKSSKTGAKPIPKQKAKVSALKSKPIPSKKTTPIVKAAPRTKAAKLPAKVSQGSSKPAAKPGKSAASKGKTIKTVSQPASKPSTPKPNAVAAVLPVKRSAKSPSSTVSKKQKINDSNLKSSRSTSTPPSQVRSKNQTSPGNVNSQAKARSVSSPKQSKSVQLAKTAKASQPAQPVQVGKAANKAQSSQPSKGAKVSKQAPPAKPATPAKAQPTRPAKSLPVSPAPKPVVKEEPKMVKAVRKGRAAVDVECPKAKDCHVYEEAAKVWTVTLNQADLKNNANKYYIIQLLQSDSNSNQYYVWNRWGRVGYPGQNALKGPFSDLNRAKADYQAKFRDKTNGGYIEVQIVYDEETESKPETPAKTSKTAKGKPAKEIKSTLDKRVLDLINLIFDLKSINRTLAEIGYDSKKMPLGKLSITTIKQGMEVLKHIENDLNYGRKSDLEKLSSQFYSLIPHDFGFQKMSNFIINTIEKVKQKVEMLESLADMKIATNILEASTQGNPNDEHYKKLNCKLSALEKNDPVYKTLETYVKNTHGNTHSYYTLEVQDIFRVDKPGESEKFVKNIKNNMLLWHGSRLTNWVGILSQGLRIAPPEAPVSGYMFGKGVYFADMVSKSANYCFTSKDNNTGILLLCDVAVGNYNEKIHSDYNAGNLPKGKHSTKGCGLTAPPEKSYITLEGCKVPIGQGEKVNLNGGYLQYNEYIVYNTNQIRMKFLFRVKFNYKY